MTETMRELLNDYHDALITQEYGMRRRELKQKDRIDIRPITNVTNLPSVAVKLTHRTCTLIYTQTTF